MGFVFASVPVIAAYDDLQGHAGDVLLPAGAAVPGQERVRRDRSRDTRVQSAGKGQRERRSSAAAWRSGVRSARGSESEPGDRQVDGRLDISRTPSHCPQKPVAEVSARSAASEAIDANLEPFDSDINVPVASRFRPRRSEQTTGQHPPRTPSASRLTSRVAIRPSERPAPPLRHGSGLDVRPQQHVPTSADLAADAHSQTGFYPVAP